MPLELKTRLTGFDQLTAALRQIPIRDWSLAWPKVIENLKSIMSEQFASEGASGPQGKWAPLSEGYAKRKAKKYPGSGILQAGGALRDSLLSESRDAVDERSADHMRWGTSLAYAAYHQIGTRKMPARPIFDFRNPDDWSDPTRILRSTAETLFRRAGFKIHSPVGDSGGAGSNSRESSQAMFSRGTPLSRAI